ncbi:hypothetical protein BKK79_15500 [Cupriavidus sp. USMAA2-4]|uniref:SURF1 family protein n=1 Tax=Cupriavidus sp. USMAA2-4 TaxID=876364 RepID=UPI0008A6E48A|nr:hypothetical protein BKK79_15500 [Cupriavidus sp. USMAA2-4]
MTSNSRDTDGRLDRPAQPRRPATLVLLALIGLLAFSTLCALGTWQVHRRAWKLDLIAHVDQRVHAPPVDAPAPARWPAVSAASDEYRHVRVSGTFLNDRETLVQASTDLGTGFWVITPLRQADGSIVLVNRGFVPPEQREPASRNTPAPSTAVTVTGLLRISEPGSRFLRTNDPARGIWYARDVAEIAAARGLDASRVAPYFIDAEAAPAAPGAAPAYPAGGLTVIAFPNNHLVYALTWYGLALMLAGGAWLVVREERRLRRGSRDGGASGKGHPTRT